MSKQYGLVGEKLSHSFSPMMHSYLGDYEYRLIEVAQPDLDTFMSDKPFDGINVTIPYKQAVIPYCATLSDEARDIGSVNTVIKDAEGALHGHNTDYIGFCAMLEAGGIDPLGKKALVLGDGGSARTVRYALRKLGTGEIVTISRRGDDNYSNISRHYDANIIINTTPVGMYPDNGSSLLSPKSFPNLSGVADLIYNPLHTKLLLDAESLGVPCANGLVMLAAQAEAACSLFTGQNARLEIVSAVTESIYKRIRNIALIGMPGCGKTTVGRALAQMTDRPFVDIDEMIEIAAGKRIPQIFDEEGEDAFRRIETQILSDESKKSGIIIATGGGIVTRPENYALLRQNSLIVYLTRPLDDLHSHGRPLSEKHGISALAEQRLHIYEAWSDIAVSVGNAPELTAKSIIEVAI
ncbi:MAG: AAA family ATPase [Oscillospiraceae bacterium]|nr:AAA family ATPase [Oscillospiraceae bacterium]